MSLRGALLAVDGVLAREAVIDELPRIAVPTLVVVGANDRAAPLRLGERVRARIPGARLVTVPTGHTSPVERPELVTAEIERHLEALAGQAR